MRLQDYLRPAMSLENWRKLLRIAFERLENTEFLVRESYRVRDGNLEIDRQHLRIEGQFTDDMPNPMSTEQQRPLIQKLMRAYKLAASEMAMVQEEYRTGSNWGGYLKSTRKDFYDAMSEASVEKLSVLLNNFCRNCMSTGILGGEPGFLQFKNATACRALVHDFRAWLYSVGDFDAWRNLGMPPIGNPYGYNVAGLLVNNNSFYNDYRAFLCSGLVDDVEQPIVAEIGGGYGGFGYALLQRNGAKTYVNFDIPENLIVSSYYLSMAFPKKRILLYENRGVTLDRETLRQYDVILMPNFMVPALADLAVDIFVNTISFSEMEYATIAAYCRQIERTCKKYFYCENLADAPRGYKGFPESVFPGIRGFKTVTVSPSRWAHFDLYSASHIYMERLLVRKEETARAE
jgi:hypothetical protein